MNFYETRQGQMFFNVQLPQLIESIQALTNAITTPKPAPAVVMPTQADPDFLSELYLGNYQADVFDPAFADHELAQAVQQAHDCLAEALLESDSDLLEQYADALAQQTSAVSELAYQSGFRTAVQMILAGLSLPAAPSLQDSDRKGA